MNKKIAMTILVALIAVGAFSGIGYSFVAMTYNEDNENHVEYAVLGQDNFTFNDDARLSYYSYTGNSTVDGSGNPHILYYMLNGGHDNLGKEIPLIHFGQKVDGTYYSLDGKQYWGMELGSSELEINLVNHDSEYVIIYIPMGGFVKNQTGQWRYFLKVSHTDGEGEIDYVEWLWSKGNGWNNFAINENDLNGLPNNQKEVERAKIRVPMGQETSYTVSVELFFGGPAQTIPGLDRTVAGVLDVMPYYNASTYKLMDDAWIRYVYDSEATSYHRN